MIQRTKDLKIYTYIHLRPWVADTKVSKSVSECSEWHTWPRGCWRRFLPPACPSPRAPLFVSSCSCVFVAVQQTHAMKKRPVVRPLCIPALCLCFHLQAKQALGSHLSERRLLPPMKTQPHTRVQKKKKKDTQNKTKQKSAVICLMSLQAGCCGWSVNNQ